MDCLHVSISLIENTIIYMSLRHMLKVYDLKSFKKLIYKHIVYND